jgi:hypothetical protein
MHQGQARAALQPEPQRPAGDGTADPDRAPDLLKDAKFRRPYAQALGPLAKEPWLMALDGPAQPVEKVRVAGNEYQFVSVCKNHDGRDTSNGGSVCRGIADGLRKIFQRGRSTLVGAPPPPVAAELERLWKATYRSGK